MGQQDQMIEEYYSRNRDTIIDCPFQPGNLKISKTACTKRRRAAGQNLEGFYHIEDSFPYFVSQGLVPCKKCPIEPIRNQA